MTSRSNFSDKQKAEIFVRDYGLCCYSAQSLWILDWGAHPFFPVDWVDHVLPSSRGGPATLENGVCADWYENKKKGAALRPPRLLLRQGRRAKDYVAADPNREAYLDFLLDRNGSLHVSDWYFNRAVYRLLLGVAYLHQGDKRYRRDDRYFAEAAMKAIKAWRHMCLEESVPSIERRRLHDNGEGLPTGDRKLMLKAREMKASEDALNLMRRLLPYFAESFGR